MKVRIELKPHVAISTFRTYTVDRLRIDGDWIYLQRSRESDRGTYNEDQFVFNRKYIVSITYPDNLP